MNKKEDGEILYKLVKENQKAPIEYFTNLIVTAPVYQKDFPYKVYNKEEKRNIREKVKNIALETIDLINYVDNLNKPKIKEIITKRINNADDIEEILSEIFKELL